MIWCNCNYLAVVGGEAIQVFKISNNFLHTFSFAVMSFVFPNRRAQKQKSRISQKQFFFFKLNSDTEFNALQLEHAGLFIYFTPPASNLPLKSRVGVKYKFFIIKWVRIIFINEKHKFISKTISNDPMELKFFVYISVTVFAVVLNRIPP